MLKGEIGVRNNEGRTALMCAVRSGHAHCIPELIQEIDIRENSNTTALMLAAASGNVKCVEQLFKQVGLTD